MEESVDELLALYKQGDFDAFEQLVGQFEKMVYNLGVRLLGRPSEAQEILQETFLQVHKALPRFEGNGGLSSWIYTIALNQCRMRLRKNKGVVTEELDETILSYKTRAPEAQTGLLPDPADVLVDKEMREQVEAAVQELPEPYRMVFVLRSMEGHSTEETARLLDLSVEAVKSRLHRSRLFLRGKLCKYFEKC